MKHLLLAPFLLGFTSPVFADLGEAEKGIQVKAFDVFCGKATKKIRNECEVTFEGNRLRVNGNEGITADQILFTELTQEMRAEGFMGYGTYYQTFTVTYKKIDGTNGFGKFTLIHSKTADAFKDKLASFTGKPVGGMGDPATAAAKKAADAQSSQQMMQGVQMMKQGMGY